MPRGTRRTSARSPRSTYMANLRLRATRYLKQDKTYAKRPLTAKGRERNSNDYVRKISRLRRSLAVQGTYRNHVQY